MKNIHILPTDKPSRLRYNLSNVLVLTKEPYRDYSKQVNQNIYITSDEEIKEGDWYYLPKENKVAKCPKTIKLSGVTPEWTQKIILTTDQDLINDGVQSIDDDFLQWFVNNPSCEEVEVESGLFFYADGEDRRYKINIPKEEPKQLNSEDFGLPKIGTKEFNDLASALFGGKPKQETLEEVGVIAAGLCQHLEAKEQAMFIAGFIECAKWQAKRMYSEEEVIVLLQKYRLDLSSGKTPNLGDTTKQWFEQFKKK